MSNSPARVDDDVEVSESTGISDIARETDIGADWLAYHLCTEPYLRALYLEVVAGELTVDDYHARVRLWTIGEEVD